MPNINKALAKKLAEKYNVLDIIRLFNYTNDWALFVERVNKTRKPVFEHQDRYIIDHSDTDYYMPHCPYGLTMFNLVRSCLHEDICMGTFIIVTNHNGLAEEFEKLLPAHSRRPVIIDRCLTAFKNTTHGSNQPIFSHAETDIIKHGVSMMGSARIHRNMLFRQMIRKNLLDSYAISYKGQS
jgi:hypothetical protein